jgi:Family of unknown function (DUF5677)
MDGRCGKDAERFIAPKALKSPQARDDGQVVYLRPAEELRKGRHTGMPREGTTMNTQANSVVGNEQWLAFGDRLIALAYAIFGEAKIDITEKLFGEPKILSLALLCRTVGNFKGVIAMTKERQVVEARILTRSCYENLYFMGALIEQGDLFVRTMHQDQIRSFRSQGEFLLEGVASEHIGDPDFVEQLRSRVKEMKSRWPKASFLTPKETVKNGTLKQSYLIYSKLSGDAAHPSILALKRHLVRFMENGEQVVGLDVNPPERGAESTETIDLACNAMLGACVAANQILGHLPAVNNELQKLFVEYGELSGALRNSA